MFNYIQDQGVIMLFVVDVGNTHTVLGVYDGTQLIRDWRIHTEPHATEDEFGVLAGSLFAGSNIQTDLIKKTIISCVVPPMVTILDGFCRKYLNHTPHWVSAESVSMMPNRYRNPAEVGADRIVNAVAAYDRYQTGLIIIDFGTATTFDVVSDKGEYLGGAISPGIMVAAEALYSHASKLPRVELFRAPKEVVGKDTVGSIQSGIIYGYAGLVDGIVNRMKKEMGTNPKIIATGGLGRLMHGISETIEAVEPSLTLEGLRLISEHI